MAGPAREIERKFRLAEVPDGLGDGEPIDQGYLAVDEQGGEVRLRRRGEEHLLTVKRGAGLERAEAEVGLSRESFSRLWPLTAGRRLAKVRYTRRLGEHEVEIDVYREALEGLAVAEVEFADPEAAERFDPPSWLGEEVTGDERYLNRTLALEGPPGRA